MNEESWICENEMQCHDIQILGKEFCIFQFGLYKGNEIETLKKEKSPGIVLAARL